MLVPALSLMPQTTVLDVKLVAVDPVALPAWLGSTLHGALGGALRALTCSPRCEETHAADPASCPYQRLFSPPLARPDLPGWINATASPPLTLRPPPPSSPRTLQPGAFLHFSIALFGKRAVLDVGYLLAGLERMAARGLGKGRARLALHRVSTADVTIWERGYAQAPPEPVAARRTPRAGVVTLHAQTPLCVIREGALEPPRFDDVIAAAARRALMLTAFYGDTSLPDLRIDALRDRARNHSGRVHAVWSPFSAPRWSSRQRRRHPMEGFLGSMEIEDPGELATFLDAATLSSVGKGTALGLGHVTTEPARLR